MNRITTIITLTFALLFARAVNAQNLIFANPAEMTDFRSTFVNPSILVFQEPHVALGGKMFHLGFVEGATNAFRHGFVSLALPNGISSEMGLGLQAQYFNSPLYSQSNISFVLSRRFKHIFALGLRFNIFSRSYDRESFDLVDADDPVFRNGTTQWAGTFGAGVSMFPLPFLSLGIGIDHINRANISLSDDAVYQPLAGYAGAVLTVGMIQASVSTFFEEDRWLTKTGISTTIRRKGFASIGYSQNAIQAEGQWRIAGPLSLNYNYEYSLFDGAGIGAGSHSLTLIHEFNHKRDLPKFELPDEFRAEFHAPNKGMNVAAKFYLYSIVDKLEIIEKKITRIISPDISPAQLARLTLHELGILDSSQTEIITPYDSKSVDLGLIPATLDAHLSRNYQSFIKEVSNDIKKKEILTHIITPKESYLRAAGLRKYFTLDSLSARNLEFLEPVYNSRRDSIYANQKLGDRPIERHETLVTLSAQSTVFRITPVSDVLKPKSWRLVVLDAKKQEVKSYEGKGMPLPELRWDWCDVFGNLVAAGIYTYQLEWRDRLDNLHSTNPKYITVQRLLRSIKIEVTNKQQGTGADADEIDIILKR